MTKMPPADPEHAGHGAGRRADRQEAEEGKGQEEILLLGVALHK